MNSLTIVALYFMLGSVLLALTVCICQHIKQRDFEALVQQDLCSIESVANCEENNNMLPEDNKKTDGIDCNNCSKEDEHQNIEIIEETYLNDLNIKSEDFNLDLDMFLIQTSNEMDEIKLDIESKELDM